MDHMEGEDDVFVRVLFRGRTMEIGLKRNSSVRDLGEELFELTGVAPHTMRLLLPSSKRVAAAALYPFSEQCSSLSLEEASVSKGQVLRMMGAFAQEISEMDHLVRKERVIGFKEEEDRARRRSQRSQISLSLPGGTFVFNGFRTLHLPGIELNPPPSKALELMHRLASDYGIVEIMKKHRWRVGVMTELAPVGYVGISPKCLLGFNKNRGEEISLRLRTDDLKGFRKYESIKKTLLHELAHMVHDEHDENFHALDKQLNQEAISLDWTKSRGRSWSGSKSYESEGDMAGVGVIEGYRLGGRKSTDATGASSAAAKAALSRFNSFAADQADLGKSTLTPEQTILVASCQEMEQDEAILASLPANGCQRPVLEETEQPETTALVFEEPELLGSTATNPRAEEPDPDHDSNMTDVHLKCVANLDDLLASREEPDPDEAEHMRIEPDPDDSIAEGVKYEALTECAVSEAYGTKSQFDAPMDDTVPVPLSSRRTKETAESEDKREPDPDELNGCTDSEQMKNGVESAVDLKEGHEPDPDESNMAVDGCDPFQSNVELKRIHDATLAASAQLQEAIEKLKEQAGPSRAGLTARMLEKILRNVTEHPNEIKFRRLRKTNPMFMQTVGQFEGALKFLSAVGFIEGGSDESGFLILKRNDPGLLWLAQTSLQSACLA